jgi:ABC-type transporter Mla subunit MlaD
MSRGALLALGTLAAVACSCGEREAPRPGGASLYVLFDERHGLEGGEPVRFHDFEVGHVESVDLAEARVRAVLSIEPEVLRQLTSETTVSVGEHESAPALFVHVLDPEAEKLAEGATIEGADSGVELTLLQAGASASKLLDSDWAKEAREAFSRIEREIEAIDWGEKKEAVEEQLEEARRAVESAAGERAEEAKKSLETAREELNEIAEELEALGRSDQARKLRELADRILGS